MINKLKKFKITDIIKNEAQKQNIRAFVVGGVTRDLILGAPIKDIDFLIEGDAINFARIAGFKIKSIHSDFGTCKILYDDIEYDIASTREETYPKKGGLPFVGKLGININDDLKRRDFTINSIALDIVKNEIIDPYNGKEDIKKGILKVLHKNSFKDDPTRILRGIDFKHRFGFGFDKETENLVRDCIMNFDNKDLSTDRVYLTLDKILNTNFAEKILEDIINQKIYKIWCNKINMETDDIALAHEACKLFDVKEKGKFYIALTETFSYKSPKFSDDYEIYQFFKKFNNLQLALFYVKTKDTSPVRYLKIKDIKLNIGGDYLINAGYGEGKIIGDILNTLLREKILNPDKIKTREDEIAILKEKF